MSLKNGWANDMLMTNKTHIKEARGLRVLYLHQYFNTRNMSGGTRSYEISRRLVDAGNEVTMITTDRAEHAARFRVSNEEGISVKWFGVPYKNSYGALSRIRAFLSFSWRAAIEGMRGDYDVVFATSTPLTIAIPGVIVSRVKRIPMVFEVRDLWPELPIAMGYLKTPIVRAVARLMEKWAYDNAQQIIALSPGMRDGVASRNVPLDKITVVPNSCDTDLFVSSRTKLDKAQYLEEIGADNCSRLVVYVGTLGAINGVAYLVHLAVELKRRGVCFVVYGDGAEYWDIKRLAEDLGVLDKNFFIFSSIPKVEVPRILAMADVATSLFIPLKEMESNSANKFFDAIAAGCPIAINYGGWHADLIREHNIGVALSQCVVTSSDILCGFLFDDEKLETASRNQFELAKSEFDRDNLVERIRKILINAVYSP